MDAFPFCVHMASYVFSFVYVSFGVERTALAQSGYGMAVSSELWSQPSLQVTLLGLVQSLAAAIEGFLALTAGGRRKTSHLSAWKQPVLPATST